MAVQGQFTAGYILVEHPPTPASISPSLLEAVNTSHGLLPPHTIMSKQNQTQTQTEQNQAKGIILFNETLAASALVV